MSKVLNKIYNEDCLIGMKRIPDGSVDMILTDLPYGTTQCKWDSIIPFEPLWEQYERVIKDNGAIVLFGTEPFSSYLRMSNINIYKYDWKWIKSKPSGHLNAKKQPMRKVEDILVFYKNQSTYNPQGLIYGSFDNNRLSRANKKDGEYTFGQERDFGISSAKGYPHNVLEFSHTNHKLINPTQKPVALFEYLIKTYTNEGETVLDSCMGSGTTAIACINTNRNYIGFELDKDYYEASLQRIEDHTRQVTIEELTQWQ